MSDEEAEDVPVLRPAPPEEKPASPPLIFLGSGNERFPAELLGRERADFLILVPFQDDPADGLNKINLARAETLLAERRAWPKPPRKIGKPRGKPSPR